MLQEHEIRFLCVRSREIFLQQPVLLELEAPIKVRCCRGKRRRNALLAAPAAPALDAGAQSYRDPELAARTGHLTCVRRSNLRSTLCHPFCSTLRLGWPRVVHHARRACLITSWSCRVHLLLATPRNVCQALRSHIDMPSSYLRCAFSSFVIRSSSRTLAAFSHTRWFFFPYLDVACSDPPPFTCALRAGAASTPAVCKRSGLAPDRSCDQTHPGSFPVPSVRPRSVSRVFYFPPHRVSSPRTTGR